MEDLIWRYIDGDCTDEEKKMVESNILNDPAFNQEYQESIALNAFLAKTSFTPMSQDFERHLNKKILETVASKTSQELMPRTWIYGLVILAILGIATALRFQGTESSYIPLLQLDEKATNMVAWVVTSFLVLVGIDQGFRKWLLLRKHAQISLF